MNGLPLILLLLASLLVFEVHSDVTDDCAGKPADVVFILDASNSIWQRDFRRQVDFVKDVVDFFTIGPKNMLVGVITYAADPRLQFSLNYYLKKNDIMAALDNIRQEGGYLTRTADALRYLRERAFAEEAGARRKVAHVAILITDGRSENTTHTAIEAAKVKAAGVHLFAVGVGSNLDMQELISLSSEPINYYTFRVDNYQGLERIRDLLAIKACAVTDPPSTTTTTTTTTTPIPTTRTTTRTTARLRAATTRRTTARTTSATTKLPSTAFTTPTTTSRTKQATTSKEAAPTKESIEWGKGIKDVTKDPKSDNRIGIIDPVSSRPGGRHQTDSGDGRPSTGSRDGRGGDGSRDGRGGDGSKDGRGGDDDYVIAEKERDVEIQWRKTTTTKAPLNEVIGGGTPRVRPSLRFETPKHQDSPDRPIYLSENENEGKYEALSASNDSSVYNPGSGRWKPEKQGHGEDSENGERTRGRSPGSHLQRPGGSPGGPDGGQGGPHGGSGGTHGGSGGPHGGPGGHSDRNVPPKTPTHGNIYTFDIDGRPILENDSRSLVEVAGPLPRIPDDSNIVIEKDQIFAIDKDGRRRLIGCIFNGTHFIGHYFFDNGKKLFYGYPTDLTDRIRNGTASGIEYAEHRVDDKRHPTDKTDPNESHEKTRSQFPDGDSDRGHGDGSSERPPNEEPENYYYPELNGDWTPSSDDVENVGVTDFPEDIDDNGEIGWNGQESHHGRATPGPYGFYPTEETGEEEEDSHYPIVLGPDGNSGEWRRDRDGKMVWYVYTCPGVYVEAPEGPPTDEYGQPVTDGQTSGQPECAGVDEDGEEVVYVYEGPGQFKKLYPDSNHDGSTDHDGSRGGAGSTDRKGLTGRGDYPDYEVDHPYPRLSEEPVHLVTDSGVQEFRRNEDFDPDTDGRGRRFRQTGRPESGRHEEAVTEVFRKPGSGSKEPETGVWTFDPSGKLRRVNDTIDGGIDLPKLDEEEGEVLVDGDKIWIVKKTGKRKLIGCIINGTHYIGFWTNKNGERLFQGYPVKNFTDVVHERGQTDGPLHPHEVHVKPGPWNTIDKDEEENGDRNRGRPMPVDEKEKPFWVDPFDSTSGPQELRGSSHGRYPDDPELGTGRPFGVTSADDNGRKRPVILDPMGRPGFWKPEGGRNVWYRYVCPGIYEPSPEEPEDLESGEVEENGAGETMCVGKDENGRNVTYVYVAPGIFKKVPHTSGQDGDDEDTSDVRRDPNKTKLLSTRGTVAPTGGKATHRPLDTTPKNGKHTKPNGAGTKNGNGNDKVCRPRKPIDLVFVIDSKSDDEASDRLMWNLTQDILSKLDLEDDRVRVQIIKECAAGLNGLDLGEYETKEDLLRALDSNLQSPSSSSAELIRSMIAAFERDDGRHGNGKRRRVGVYVTDGQSDDIEETVEASQKAKHAHDVQLFSVGVGHKVNPTELRAIASCEVDRHYYAVNHHSKADAVAKKISKVVCLGR